MPISDFRKNLVTSLSVHGGSITDDPAVMLLSKTRIDFVYWKSCRYDAFHKHFKFAESLYLSLELKDRLLSACIWGALIPRSI